MLQYLKVSLVALDSCKCSFSETLAPAITYNLVFRIDLVWCPAAFSIEFKPPCYKIFRNVVMHKDRATIKKTNINEWSIDMDHSYA